MPNLDGTGPKGKGPLTGRRRGLCRNKQDENSEKKSIENEETVYGFGFGWKSKSGNRGREQGNRRRSRSLRRR